MTRLGKIWKYLTPTKALVNDNSPFQSLFFETIYRLNYIMGLSVHETSLLYLLYNYIVKVMIFLYMSSEMWYLYTYSKALNLDRVIDNMNLSFIHLIAVYRYRIMLNNEEKTGILMQAMDSEHLDVSTSRRQDIVQKWYKRSEMYLAALLSVGSSSLAFWYIYPLLDDLEYNLPVAVRIPIEYDKPIVYPIVYILVIVSYNYTAFFVMINDLKIQVIFMQILCRYQILEDCFRNILRDSIVSEENKDKQALEIESENKYLSRLDLLIAQHKFIVSNCVDLKNFLSIPLLYQFIISGMIICCAAYQVTITMVENRIKCIMSICYLGYTLLQLFIFCRWCDEMGVQSQNICYAVYCSGWEGGIAKVRGVRLSLMLVMARASNPVMISAGGLYGLTLESFASVIKTSYSALTMLLRFRFS